jgi:hypothetical protein
MSGRVDLCHLLGVEVDLLLHLVIREQYALLFSADHQHLLTGEVEDFHLLHDHLMIAVGDDHHLRADLCLDRPQLLFVVGLLHQVEEETGGTEDLLDIHLKS